jgi:predicted O-methyltransferase YrrM
MTHTTTTDKTINWQTAPGHEILAAAGKTILRPGGQAATTQLWQWADFQPGETVLELASGLGKSAIALAQRYGVTVVGIEKNPERVAIAQAHVQAAGLADQVEIRQGDIFHLAAIPQQFDYVLAEAILTMQSPAGKGKILQGVSDRLKPSGLFLSHELQVNDRAAEIHQALAAAIHANATPLTVENWTATLATAHLTVQHCQTGKMALLSLPHVIQDEGILNTLRIGWNVLSQPQLRSRVLAMRQVFQCYQANLGYIILAAQKDG